MGNIAPILARFGLDAGAEDALMQGIDRDELDALLAPSARGAVEVARMNLIGALRAAGHEVTGGARGGRRYQVTGRAIPRTPKLPASQWTGAAREVLDWLEGAPAVTMSNARSINQALAEAHAEPKHESSFAYLWSYELANDEGRLVQWQGEPVVVIKRFTNLPRLRIFALNNHPATLMSLAKRLAPGSTRPVLIHNVASSALGAYRALGAEKFQRRREAIVRTDVVVEQLGKGGWRSALRKARREMEFRPLADAGLQTQLEVLQAWLLLNRHKHPHLATGRDEVAMRSALCSGWVGYRNNDAVSVLLNCTLPNRPDVACLLVEKSLNYARFPDGTPCAGGYGTADGNLAHSIERLRDAGCELYNLGSLEAGGLRGHKLRYARRDDLLVANTIVTPYEHHA